MSAFKVIDTGDRVVKTAEHSPHRRAILIGQSTILGTVGGLAIPAVVLGTSQVIANLGFDPTIMSQSAWQSLVIVPTFGGGAIGAVLTPLATLLVDIWNNGLTGTPAVPKQLIEPDLMSDIQQPQLLAIEDQRKPVLLLSYNHNKIKTVAIPHGVKHTTILDSGRTIQVKSIAEGFQLIDVGTKLPAFGDGWEGGILSPYNPEVQLENTQFIVQEEGSLHIISMSSKQPKLSPITNNGLSVHQLINSGLSIFLPKQTDSSQFLQAFSTALQPTSSAETVIISNSNQETDTQQLKFPLQLNPGNSQKFILDSGRKISIISTQGGFTFQAKSKRSQHLVHDNGGVPINIPQTRFEHQIENLQFTYQSDGSLIVEASEQKVIDIAQQQSDKLPVQSPEVLLIQRQAVLASNSLQPSPIYNKLTVRYYLEQNKGGQKVDSQLYMAFQDSLSTSPNQQSRAISSHTHNNKLQFDLSTRREPIIEVEPGPSDERYQDIIDDADNGLFTRISKSWKRKDTRGRSRQTMIQARAKQQSGTSVSKKTPNKERLLTRNPGQQTVIYDGLTPHMTVGQGHLLSAASSSSQESAMQVAKNSWPTRTASLWDQFAEVINRYARIDSLRKAPVIATTTLGNASSSSLDTTQAKQSKSRPKKTSTQSKRSNAKQAKLQQKEKSRVAQARKKRQKAQASQQQHSQSRVQSSVANQQETSQSKKFAYGSGSSHFPK